MVNKMANLYLKEIDFKDIDLLAEYNKDFPSNNKNFINLKLIIMILTKLLIFASK